MRGPHPPEEGGDQEERLGPPRVRGLLGWLFAFAVIALVVWLVINLLSKEYELKRAQLHELLQQPGALEQVYIKGNVIYGTFAAQEYVNTYKTTKFTVHLYPDEIPAYNTLLLETLGHRFGKKGDTSSPSYIPDDPFIWQTLLAMLPWVFILLLIWFFVSRQMRAASGPGGVLSFGRSRARLARKEHVKVTFDDVAGIEEAKEDVKEIIEFLKNPQRFQVLGGRIPRGVMLVGPPGTGKTLLAKAIAGEADVPFFSISGSDFVEMFVGVGASRVRDLFRQAKESSPCIIFLDEIDAVGRRRTVDLPGGSQETSQTLNAILVEMDGFETNEQVIVIAATNRPDVLDPALRRPGRFDREVIINLPDLREREEILQVHARNVKLADGTNLGVLARGTPGFSGADLAAIVNEGAIRATMLNKSAVEQDDLEEARDKVRWGREKRSRVMDEEERGLAAHHEAGHVLMSFLLEPDVEPLHKVSIIPRAMALGATMFLPEKDRYTIKRKQCLGRIMVAFAGRVTEELFFGDISSGAADDIRRATELARRMVCDWGMSDRVGPVRYTAHEDMTPWGTDVFGPREHSDATAHQIDQEVGDILRQCYDRTRELLERNREALGRIAAALLKREAMTAEEARHEIRDLVLHKDVPAGAGPIGTDSGARDVARPARPAVEGGPDSPPPGKPAVPQAPDTAGGHGKT